MNTKSKLWRILATLFALSLVAAACGDDDDGDSADGGDNGDESGEVGDDFTLCLETEFPTRDDGLVLFEEEYGVDVPESNIEILDTGVIYQETASGNCDYGEVFTTDGRIAGLDLNLVEDPGVFILYNVSLTLPDDVYQTAPEAFDGIVDAMLAPLDEDRMTELNRQRDIDGEDAADVAAGYIEAEGLAEAAGEFDLSGQSYSVGSKDFTENIVLGQIMVQLLEAAGADVDDQTNLGGTVQNRDALLSGDIDMYFEYNGTGWQVHLEQPDPSFDPDELTADVREMDLAENNVQWIGQSPFNDTYGFATPPGVGPISLEEMADQIKAATGQ
ncbi:MAG: hypothetical protein OSA99_03125 [Acidimicrobiales bacterium]|nr:hypothetical protein [Acidimicrobiales bacterium]